MGGQYGVQEIIAVLDLGFTGVAIGEEVLADGKVSFLEALKFLPLVPKALTALKGVSTLPKELAELDSDDQAAIIAYVASRLPDVTASAKVQDVAGAYLKAVIAVAQAVQITVA